MRSSAGGNGYCLFLAYHQRRCLPAGQWRRSGQLSLPHIPIRSPYPEPGRLPLWNPHLYGGAPFIGDIQAGFLYPPNLLLFLLNPTFNYRWMQLLSIGHLWWAGLGVYALARTLGCSRPAALLAGLAFGLCDILFIHLGNLNLIAVLSWSGWILAACHRALTRSSLVWAGVAAVLFAIANYAGHAQSSYYLGMAVGIYSLGLLAVKYWELFVAKSPRTALWQSWPAFNIPSHSSS